MNKDVQNAYLKWLHSDKPGRTTQSKRKIKRAALPPPVEEVQEYIKQIGSAVDAEFFLDYYEARGWVSKGSKIVSWKHCLNTWEKKRQKSPQSYKTRIQEWMQQNSQNG